MVNVLSSAGIVPQVSVAYKWWISDITYAHNGEWHIVRAVGLSTWRMVDGFL